jgi:hypothetical protein
MLTASTSFADRSSAILQIRIERIHDVGETACGELEERMAEMCVRLACLTQPAPTAVYLTFGEPLSTFLSRNVTFVVRSERVGTAGFLQHHAR